MRLYLDTSVIGGYYDKEFSIHTMRFFSEVKRRSAVLLLSDVLDMELIGAPDRVINFYQTLRTRPSEKLKLSAEAINLAELYISEKVVGPTSRVDCRHIAMATLASSDILASWNFKHIVNVDRIKGYNSINLREGYPQLEIRSPREIFHYE